MSDQIIHWYLHVDLDAFFASVEQLDNPEFRGKPVIVGGKPEDRRGVVSTASYEARKYGVHSAMPTYKAYQLCPNGIFVHGRMERYQEISFKIMTIFKDYSPDVDQMSIDEAFIDLTGTEKLFGPPEQTAQEIKKRVFLETGLTVSVGLACSKYIAKIASGYSKPNGFCFVKPGEEEKFMLSLPLSKLWGAGEKTQEALKKNGIRTMKDLYDRDLSTLKILYGNNLAQFLYNSVRGQEFDSFKKSQPENHSLSTERTFPFDLFDSYGAETYLMELCHNVFFRLLRENGYSKTAFLKIRYNDFSTTSIQTTELNNILTLDSFYEIIKKLFEKKYEKGRGIRLLGVGFDNITNEEGSKQLELFDDGSEKKQKIEKAILNLEKKHPEIKIQKARVIAKTKILIFSIFMALTIINQQKVYSQNITQSKGAGTILPDTLEQPVEDSEQEDSPQELGNWKLSEDSNVEFIADGYWIADFEGSATFNFGKEKDFESSINLPIFKQEVDLYTWLFLNQKYFFEADFADEFKKNTFTLGYNGSGYLKSARISNRNITMPSIYAANFFGFGLGGGNNQAPGLSFHFEDKDFSRWSGDFLFRYDMTHFQSATFYGMNSVSDEKQSLDNFIYGQSFILPEENSNLLGQIKSIYVENPKGNYTDSYKKKYIKLTASQYQIFQSSQKIVLSYNAKAFKQNGKIPTILVTFNDSTCVEKILAACGSYSEKNSFLGKIQTFFNEKNNKINLSDFAYPLKNRIDDLDALVIQNTTGFSPFLVANTYDCGLIKDSDTFVISESSEKILSEYTAVSLDQEVNGGTEDFFNLNHQYVQIYKEEFINKSLQNPQVRYPFADINPKIYLNLAANEDMCLLVRNYTEVSEFNIGTEAAAGTVQVYINGILDSLSEYNSESGRVIISKTVSQTDKIYIVWQEDTADFSGGTIAAGAGFIYKFLPDLSSDIAVTMRWPVSSFEKFTTADNPSNGFAAMSMGINYLKDFKASKLELSNKTAISVQNTNPTGTLMAYTPDNNKAKTHYIFKDSGYKTQTEPILVTPAKTIILDNENNGNTHSSSGNVISGIEDENITGYKIPLEWDFSTLNKNKENWASIDIKLYNGENLKNSYEAEFSFLPAFSDKVSNEDYDIYFQLGIEAGEIFNGEESYNIPCWKIDELSDSVKTSLDITKNEWQTITINLTEEQRAKLVSNYDARLIVLGKETSKKGLIYTGPYEPHQQSLIFDSDSNISIYSKTELSHSPSSKEFFNFESYTNNLIWQIDNPNFVISENQAKITMATYFTPVDFSSYKTLKYDFYISKLKEVENDNFSQNDAAFSLILDSDSTAINENGKIALKLELHEIEALISSDETFHTLEIDLENEQIKIDNEILSPSAWNLEINKNLLPNRQKIVLNTAHENKLITKGEIHLSNLYFQESLPFYTGQNNASLKFSKPDSIIKIGNYSLLKNGEIEISASQNGTITDTQDKNNLSGNLENMARGTITFADIVFGSTIDTYYDQNTDSLNFIKSASHLVRTEHPLFKIFTAEENYNYNKVDNSTKKSDVASLNLNPYRIPLMLSSSFFGSQQNNIQNQNNNYEITSDFKIKNYKGKIKLEAKTNENINANTNKDSLIILDDYFNCWYNLSELEFSQGSSKASSRNVIYNFTLANNFPFANFMPSLEYSIASNYKLLDGANFTDISNISLKFPFGFIKNHFYFNITHNGIGYNKVETDNYLKDTEYLFGLYPKRIWFYSSIPFYELFQKDLPAFIHNFKEQENADYLTYSAKYELGWKRNMYNSLIDFFVPSSIGFTVTRDIKTSEEISDLYQIKYVQTQTSINNFGKFSRRQLFNWYETDEFLSNITAVMKIPAEKPDECNFEISAYFQSLLFIKDLDNLKFATDFSINEDINWNGRFTAIYTRNSNASLIAPLLNIIAHKEISNSVIRKDTLNISLRQTDTLLTQNYEYSHSCDVKFLKFYTVNYGAGITYKHVPQSWDSATVSLSIGGKMEF